MFVPILGFVNPLTVYVILYTLKLVLKPTFGSFNNFCKHSESVSHVDVTEQRFFVRVV